MGHEGGRRVAPRGIGCEVGEAEIPPGSGQRRLGEAGQVTLLQRPGGQARRVITTLPEGVDDRAVAIDQKEVVEAALGDELANPRMEALVHARIDGTVTGVVELLAFLRRIGVLLDIELLGPFRRSCAVEVEGVAEVDDGSAHGRIGRRMPRSLSRPAR